MRAALAIMLVASSAAAQPRATGPATAPDHLELPVSGLRVPLPPSAWRADHAFVAELDADVDIITPLPAAGGLRDDAFSVRVTLRDLTCRAMRDTARGIVPGLRELPTDGDPALAPYERTYLGEDDAGPHHIFLCADRGSRAVMVELVEPAGRAWHDVAGAIARALPGHDASGSFGGDAPGLLLPTRLFVGGSYARTRPETTIGGRLGFEAFAGRDHGTGLASGLGGAFGLDGDLHATYELHLKAGVAHVFASRTALYVTARGGFQRSWPSGDAKFGWYGGGEADLHLPYLDVAGGVTTRGQFARLAVIRFHYDPTQPRATQYGASAGVEWIHDGQVQMVSLYLAMAD